MLSMRTRGANGFPVSSRIMAQLIEQVGFDFPHEQIPNFV